MAAFHPLLTEVDFRQGWGMGVSNIQRTSERLGAAVLARITIVLLLIVMMGLAMVLVAASGTVSDPEKGRQLADMSLSYIGAAAGCITSLGFLQIGGKLHHRHWMWFVAAAVAITPSVLIGVSYLR